MQLCSLESGRDTWVRLAGSIQRIEVRLCFWNLIEQSTCAESTGAVRSDSRATFVTAVCHDGLG